MTTAIIADDEPNMREMLREQIEMLWPELEILGEAEDGPSAFSLIQKLHPDVAFLDVRMPGLTGLQVARSITTSTRVVFVTAYEAHAIAAFDADAVDYVVKPVDPERMARLVARLKKVLDQRPVVVPRQAVPVQGPQVAALSFLNIETGTKCVHSVHVDDVIYFHSDKKSTIVVARDCEGSMKISLTQLLAQLSSDLFLDIHRGYIVNRRSIHAVHRLPDQTMEIELRDRSERLPVAKTKHHLFRAM